MKIAGIIIQPRNINHDSEFDFEATYKGKTIYITTKHGHGRPERDYLTRYDIDVIDKSGSYDVQTWEDLHSLRDAIIYALKGACLIYALKGACLIS
jgi:hypothetical protein